MTHEIEDCGLHQMNFEITDGMFGFKKRVLQTYTLHYSPAGRVYVRDQNQNNIIVGGGFETPEDAIKWFKPFDHKRTGLW